jgi:hypothetical protein
MIRTALFFAFVIGLPFRPAAAQVLRERLEGSLLGQFGTSAAGLGDVDGDGIDDYAIGEPYYRLSSASNEGRVSIYSGATGTRIRDHVGSAGDCLGACVHGAGDVDGDGAMDVIAGAPCHSSTQYLEEGRAVVYSGSSGALLWSVDGLDDFEHVGVSVDFVGDLDGDGHVDAIVGSDANYALLVDANGAVLKVLGGGLLFGHTVAGIDDVDADLVPDFLVSQSWFDVSATKLRRGRVWVYSGATATSLFKVVGDANDDYLGRALSRLGDVDGDAVPDFIAASYVSSQGGNQAGLVRVLSGKDGTTIHQLLGSAASEWFGFSVSGSRDLDGDAVPDFLVGIPGVPGTGSHGLGEARLQSGADAHVEHAFVGSAAGGATNVALGMSVASGDFNGDGHPDCIVGDPLFDDPAAGGKVGASETYLGCPASWSNYGAGWPGTLGVPSLTARGEPGIGTTCTLDLSNSLGSATPGLLLIGVSSTSTTLSSGATLLVIPSIVVALTVPAGGLVFSGDIPNDPSLCFVPLFLQGIELDAGAVGNLSFTAGLELDLGFDL